MYLFLYDIVRAIRPSALLALEYASWHCLICRLQIMSDEHAQIFLFIHSIEHMIIHKILKSIIICPNCITMHLEELKGICHLSDHVTILTGDTDLTAKRLCLCHC